MTPYHRCDSPNSRCEPELSVSPGFVLLAGLLERSLPDKAQGLLATKREHLDLKCMDKIHIMNLLFPELLL